MITYDYLRPKKADALKKWHEREFPKKAELGCQTYDNATILPIKRVENETLQFGHGGVLTEKGEYVASSGIQGRIGGAYLFSETNFSEEAVIYCGYLVPQWGHFLIEGVSRLWIALEKQEAIDGFVFVVKEGESTQLSGNYREFLELLGILNRVTVINRPTRYRKVVVPELGYSRTHYYSTQYCDLFQKVVEAALKRPSPSDCATRVFLSRSQFSKARTAEAGLNLLDNFFATNGFRILFPEQLSLTELIWYIQKAEVCAAESGTVPHNFLFAQQNTKCIICERQAVPNEIQANIDIIAGLNSIYIDGQYTIYPVSAGYGPYFLAYNSYFMQFAEDYHLDAPDRNYCDEACLRRSLRQYMKVYKNTYGYGWGMEWWMLMYSDVIFEAYMDSKKILGEYLSMKKPFMLKHFFSINYIKQRLKQFLRKR